MPDRPLTIATYAAGASLAAITLVYVFGPTYFLDDDAAKTSRSSRKRGVVGLMNPANDCFINSVLQVLAGIPELRAYLIREIHRRKLDGPELYDSFSKIVEEEEHDDHQKKNWKSRSDIPEWKAIGLQQGLVTIGLKEVLDALNERPIYKKTISAQSFIRVVEQALRTRISRSQQDAQEFLQVITERLADEYYAAAKVRRKSKQAQSTPDPPAIENNADVNTGTEDTPANGKNPTSRKNRQGNSKMIFKSDTSGSNSKKSKDETLTEEEPIFPLEGQLESEVECSHCGFKPTPSKSSFLTLTLNVPHNETSTSLNACLDGMLKIEHIDDFRCDRCRLEHALQVNSRRLSSANLSSEERKTLESDRFKLSHALKEDPEKPPKDVQLPNLSTSPKRRITRHTRISKFPQTLAIHLSRSIWDPHAVSSKNLAKVSFPETLPLGGLLERHNYRLLGVVTHKGGHNSGHYESFRRQFLTPPFSTRASLGTEGIYSVRASPAASPAPSPHLNSLSAKDKPGRMSNLPETTLSTAATGNSDMPTLPPPTPSSSSDYSLSALPERPAVQTRQKVHPSPPFESIPTPGLPSPPGTSGAVALSSTRPESRLGVISRSSSNALRLGTRKTPDRWWRMSDDRIKECKTSDVLSMQREVYLLFFEQVTSVEG